MDKKYAFNAMKNIAIKQVREGGYMTEIDKAIKLLKADESYLRLRIPKHTFCEYNLAISALEKQIPKKIIYDYGLNETRCPTCNTIFGYAEFGEEDEYYAPYCYECGQKLDWEEEL